MNGLIALIVTSDASNASSAALRREMLLARGRRRRAADVSSRAGFTSGETHPDRRQKQRQELFQDIKKARKIRAF
jgi:hypothetical protein